MEENRRVEPRKDTSDSNNKDKEQTFTPQLALSSSLPLENLSNITTSSENTNNENFEKELRAVQTAPPETIVAVGVVEGVGESQMTVADKSIENRENSARDDDDKYSKNLTYNEKGEAIYTDPETKFRYKWCEIRNEWVPESETATVSRTVSNPYENEHYKWCAETNQWIPKAQTPSSIENEHYKWDAEKNQWIPKVQKGAAEKEVYVTEDGTKCYKDKDGVVFFWDAEKKAWFPKIDDDFMAMYQMSYGFIDNTTSTSAATSSESETKNLAISKSKDTSKNVETDEQDEKSEKGATTAAGAKRKAPAEPPKWFEIAPDQNTKVYVSHLPEDITEEEFIQLMSKCGLIMRDPHTNKFKVKLYAEPDGQLKGDGLCDYIKVESVDLAIDLLDGYDVRGKKIKIQRAKFEMRGEYNPALKPKKNKKSKEKLQKMKEKLFDWRPEKMRGERSKHERVVILKNLFTPELFDKEVHLIIDYQNDLREEAKKCGTVRRVVIYDRHPEGVAQITMADPEEADLVVQMMQGRYFGKRQLTAELWDGKTKFKIDESKTEEKKRLTNWDEFLKADEEAAAAKKTHKVSETTEAAEAAESETNSSV